ncbi:uncharacterized protein LOC110944789 [Helianthus annuus]|uniref:uncharacterized protein LOC110944789 n=1 Tax=Helianthus annuus TaxID=4232 RepID=UPI000B903A52|nr:uncharacterized protein LOC110944789 [Helianthus annuus]
MCMVRDRVVAGNTGPVLTWDWARLFIGGVELLELQSLLTILCAVTVESGCNKFIWNYDESGVFTVASLKKILGSFKRNRPNCLFVWNNWNPKKVGIVSWREEKERLPMRCPLARRRINVPDLVCMLCREYDETGEHLFVLCHFAQTIWQNIAICCKIPPIIAFDLKDILGMHDFCPGSRKKKKALNAIFLVTVWSIWKARNEVLFRSTQPSVSKVLEEVKALAFLWVKNRSKEASMTWENWSSFNIFG